MGGEVFGGRVLGYLKPVLGRTYSFFFFNISNSSPFTTSYFLPSQPQDAGVAQTLVPEFKALLPEQALEPWTLGLKVRCATDGATRARAGAAPPGLEVPAAAAAAPWTRPEP